MLLSRMDIRHTRRARSSEEGSITWPLQLEHGGWEKFRRPTINFGEIHQIWPSISGRCRVDLGYRVYLGLWRAGEVPPVYHSNFGEN